MALPTRHHKRRRPRRSRPSQDTIKDRVSIHERPKHVEARTEGGHWEGDLIICKGRSGRQFRNILEIANAYGNGCG